MNRCCLCGCMTTVAVQRVDGAYCLACNNPPTLTTLQLLCLVAAGAIAVIVMVAGITALASI